MKDTPEYSFTLKFNSIPDLFHGFEVMSVLPNVDAWAIGDSVHLSAFGEEARKEVVANLPKIRVVRVLS